MSKMSSTLPLTALLLLLVGYGCSLDPRLVNRKRYKRGFNHHLDSSKITLQNLTCDYIVQPLDHFSSSTNQTFRQRYCYYDKYVNDDLSPIFYYIGNESPLDEYVNNTGLMYELAAKEKISALLVFAEHRFEGESIPNFAAFPESMGCFSYLTSSQALADSIALISYLNPKYNRPVVAFGGSYGGMLSSWLRMKYPGTVQGAIASSAPIFGLPLTMSGNITNKQDWQSSPNDGTMDGAFHIVGSAIQTTINGSKKKGRDNSCYENLLMAWPLMQQTGTSKEGRVLLSESFDLCEPLRYEEDVQLLIEWVQSPWFDLAEGDYPYESSYIPFALGEGDSKLPAWPLQFSCESSGLANNLNISITGDISNVHFNIWLNKTRALNDGNDDMLLVQVDWRNLTANDRNFAEFQKTSAREVFSAVKNAVAVWFNVTKNLNCFDVIPAINVKNFTHLQKKEFSEISRKLIQQNENVKHFESRIHSRSKQEMCIEKLQNETVWTSLICNENMNLIMTYARGVGRDPFWPPSHDKVVQDYLDTLRNRKAVEESYEQLCADPLNYYGYPDKALVDPMSSFLDSEYGGTRIESHSNIIFAGGLLDPWSAAGVYANNIQGNLLNQKPQIKYPFVQNLTHDGSMIALLMDLGGHHLDLMWSDPEDPPCAEDARIIQELHIEKWIESFYKAMYTNDGL